MLSKPRARGGSVGLRFTLLYAAVFLVSGIGLLVLTFLFAGGSVSSTSPVQPGLPGGDLTRAHEQIRDLQDRLAAADALHSRQLLTASAVALIVMAAVSVLLGRALAARVLRPLRLITAATRRISAESLDRRISPAGPDRRLAVAGPPDEVKDLADTIDDLLERLEASFAAQRRFVANASHELRTPLATMRATLDVAAAKPQPAEQTVALAGRLRGQLDKVDHLLDGFLTLARAEHRTPGDGRVSLAELASAALAARDEDVVARRLTVRQETGAPAWTRGDPALLSRMVQNVIDNAVQHNEPGGWIHVSTGDAAEARLVVETGGAVLDQAEVDRLARPFERLGADRTGSDQGTGLGLSIVAAIATAHGGDLGLRARAEGGLRVTLTLPGGTA